MTTTSRKEKDAILTVQISANYSGIGSEYLIFMMSAIN